MVQGGTIGQPLAGRKVLVVEDEYLIADDLAAMLQEAGAEVIGPAASLPHAVRLTEHQQSLDAAVLDINLRGVEVFPLANELKSAGIPIIFLTGYGDINIPEEFSHYGRCEKPMGTPHVITELAALLRSEPASA